MSLKLAAPANRLVAHGQSAKLAQTLHCRVKWIIAGHRILAFRRIFMPFAVARFEHDADVESDEELRNRRFLRQRRAANLVHACSAPFR
ncbi:MAG: hypothetical protein WBO17_10085 [Sphingorhabdus sp.]